MPVEFIGFIATQDQSEIGRRPGPDIDPAFVREFARAHEAAGFDKVLIGYSASRPDGAAVAAHAAASTERLGMLVAHRPGVVFPTYEARTLATLDQLSGGRIVLNIIAGGSDAEQRRDGDYLSKDDRYARMDEYLDLFEQLWVGGAPISHEGRFYKFEGYTPEVTPHQPRIPLYLGGASPAARDVAARRADVFMMWGEPLADTAKLIADVRSRAAAQGREIRFSVSFRPILGRTEEEAWERAHRTLDIVLAAKAAGGPAAWPLGGAAPQNDRALWTSLAAATGASGNSTALVGTPETVAAAILDYVELGVSAILIRGYDPYDDAVEYGRELIPLVRQEVARREQSPV